MRKMYYKRIQFLKIEIGEISRLVITGSFSVTWSLRVYRISFANNQIILKCTSKFFSKYDPLQSSFMSPFDNLCSLSKNGLGPLISRYKSLCRWVYQDKKCLFIFLLGMMRPKALIMESNFDLHIC